MRPLIKLSAVFAFLAALSATAQADVKVVIGYTGANAFLPAFVAKEKGFFEKRGLDVTMRMVPVGSTIPAAILSGSITFGTLTPPIYLLATESGLPLVIVAAATLQEEKNVTAGLMGRVGVELKPADFVGKRVGVPGINGVQHVIFLKWLEDKGVDPKRVTFVEVGFPQMGDMLKAGQIDAATASEPFVSRILQSGGGILLSKYTAEVSPSYLESFYVTTSQWASSNKKAIEGFRAALREGQEFIEKNRAEASRIQAKYLSLPQEISEKLPLPTFVVDVQPDSVRYWIDLTRSFNITKGTKKLEELIVP